MDAYAARNALTMHSIQSYDEGKPYCQTQLDSVVLEIIYDLCETGRYDSDAVDDRLLHDARLSLLQLGTTLTVAEVDQAIDKWRELNAALVEA